MKPENLLENYLPQEGPEDLSFPKASRKAVRRIPASQRHPVLAPLYGSGLTTGEAAAKLGSLAAVRMMGRHVTLRS